MTPLRRVALVAGSIALSLVAPGAVLGAGFATTMAREFSVTVPGSPIPERTLTHDEGRIRVAVLLGASGSVATDALGPYEVFGSSARFDVYSVSVSTDPVPLSGGLTAVPDYSVGDLAAGRGPWPQILVVPAVTDPTGASEAPLRGLIEQVQRDGGVVLGVCAGAHVLATTDVLDGRRATSHWLDIDGLRQSHPGTEWLSGVRWVQDGNVVTTGGVTSGIDGALHLVEGFAGREAALGVALEMGYNAWTPGAAQSMPINRPEITDYPYVLGATLPWFQPRYAIKLVDGVRELDVAATAEVYGAAAFVAHTIPVAARSVVTTAHGMRLVATPFDEVGQVDRVVTPAGFDRVLRDVAAADGHLLAVAAAKYVEYPLPELPATGGIPVRVTVLAAVTAVLAVLLGWLPGLLLAARRRRGARA